MRRASAAALALFTAVIAFTALLGCQTCPSDVPPIPAAPVYECEAGLPDAGGCPAFLTDGGGGAPTFPLGCRLLLPEQAGMCAGACCGPQVCTCSQLGVAGSAPTFSCPM